MATAKPTCAVAAATDSNAVWRLDVDYVHVIPSAQHRELHLPHLALPTIFTIASICAFLGLERVRPSSPLNYRRERPKARTTERGILQYFERCRPTISGVSR
jgi:hypothetical protein